MKTKDLKINFRYLGGNIACLSVDSIDGESVHNDINNEEAIIIFNSIVGEKENYQTVKKLLQENQELKEKLDKYENPEDMTLMMMWCTEKVKDENEKLKEEITNLSKDVDMWNAKYNDMFDENRMLKKQLEECQLQNFDLREDIMIQKQAIPNKLIKDKTFYDLYDMPTYEDLLTQQKEFIKWLEDYINLFDKKDIYEEGSCNMLEEILQKYRSIIGCDKVE